MVKVGCLVGQVSLIVCCLEGSVLTADLDGAVNKIRGTYGFEFKLMLEGYLGVQLPVY